MSGILESLALALCNSINPSLALLTAAAPMLDRRWKDPPGSAVRTGRWIAASAVGIAVTVVLAESGKHFEVWSGHPEFPSGHASFASAAAAGLIARDRRWVAAAMPLALTMGWALVRAGFHSPMEVAAGLALGSVVAGGIVGLTARTLSASTGEREPSPATERC